MWVGRRIIKNKARKGALNSGVQPKSGAPVLRLIAGGGTNCTVDMRLDLLRRLIKAIFDPLIDDAEITVGEEGHQIFTLCPLETYEDL